MEYNKEKYVNGKKIRIYPNDTYKKDGYILDVDDLGFTYEVTDAERERDKGIYFVSHSIGLRYHEI